MCVVAFLVDVVVLMFSLLLLTWFAWLALVARFACFCRFVRVGFALTSVLVYLLQFGCSSAWCLHCFGVLACWSVGVLVRWLLVVVCFLCGRCFACCSFSFFYVVVVVFVCFVCVV